MRAWGWGTLMSQHNILTRKNCHNFFLCSRRDSNLWSWHPLDLEANALPIEPPRPRHGTDEPAGFQLVLDHGWGYQNPLLILQKTHVQRSGLSPHEFFSIWPTTRSTFHSVNLDTTPFISWVTSTKSWLQDLLPWLYLHNTCHRMRVWSHGEDTYLSKCTIQTSHTHMGSRCTWCDSVTGYCIKFKLYTGKSDLPVSRYGMMQGYMDKGFTQYMDNYYSGLQLYWDLWVCGVGATGTLRSNRQGIPQMIKDAPCKEKAGPLLRHTTSTCWSWSFMTRKQSTW